jgi:hypothetical protein
MARVTFGTFSLEAPEGWSLSSVILAGPVDDAPKKGLLSTKAVRPFQRNLITTLEVVPDSETPESYVQRQIKGLKEAGVQRQEAAKPERIKLPDGLEGLLTEQIIVSHEGERVRQMQIVVLIDGVAHTVIASHLDGAPFESARAEFRSMLTSVALPPRRA